MKLKTLAAVAALAVVSASPALANIKAVDDGTSEIFLVVGDNNGSFLYDTGVTLNAMLAGATFSRAVAGTAWTAYKNSDTNLLDGSSSSVNGTRWSLFVFDGSGASDSTQFRVITTLGTGVTPATVTFDADTMIGSYGATGNIAQQANGTGTHPGLPSVNGSSFNAKGTTGYLGNGFFNFGDANTKIGNAVNTSSQLAFIRGSDAFDSSLPVAVSYLANGAVASFDGTTLTVSAVPEPESYALMLGGLAAVGFMARRRRAI